MLDADRAFLNAGAAGRTLPELFFGDVLVEQAVLHDFADAAGARVVAFPVDEARVLDLLLSHHHHAAPSQ